MASYIMLANYTSLGIRNINAKTQRARDFKKENEKVGIKVKDIYWTMGHFDIVVIAEARVIKDRKVVMERRFTVTCSH